MDTGIGQTVRYGQRLDAFWASRQRSSDFPDPQVRLSLRALLPGIRALHVRAAHGRHLALILAGNTPLVGWPAALYALSEGWQVTVKRSRDERVWIDALAESLAACAPEWDSRLTLLDADHAGTAALVSEADAAICYGSDSAVAALRAASAGKPFLGFGHALSVALWPVGGQLLADRLAQDVLLYDQAGCLSPQALFSTQPIDRARLALAFHVAVAELGSPPRTDPGACRIVREVRDLSAMDGCEVIGDPELRWTLIVHPEPRPLPTPTGLCVLHVIPLARPDRFGDCLGPATGRLTCVGVAGEITDTLRDAARAAGATRICPVGQMQTPPLDWPNGGVDLAPWLRR